MRQARLGTQNIERDAARLGTLLPGEWELLEEIILAGASASETFSSISQRYRALVLVSQMRSSATAESDLLLCRMNGDTGSNYDWIYGYFRGDNSEASNAGIAQTSIHIGWGEAANSRASNFSPCLTWFPGYALTDREKWALTPAVTYFGNVSANTDMYIAMGSGRWRDTDAITSLTVFCNSGNLAAGSRFTLYGVL